MSDTNAPKKTTKVMRYQIVKPYGKDITWASFGKILRELNYETAKILNKSIQLAWEYNNFSADYKKEHGKYPSSKEILGYSNVMGYAYNQLKDDFTKLNTGNFSDTVKRATDKFKTDSRDIFLGNKSIANFKQGGPLDIKSAALRIRKEDSSYVANMGLISNKYKKELGLDRGSFDVILSSKEGTQKSILDRIISEEYKLCASQIINRNNKWFLNLVYQFELQDVPLDKNKILGVDLGIVNVATMSVYDSSTGRYNWVSWNNSVIDGKELIVHRQRTEARKKSIQKQSKAAGEGRIGHGYKTKMKCVDVMTDKVGRFRDTYNHKISKYIVDFALKNNCKSIQLENLSGFSEQAKDRFLKNWSYHDLQKKTEYKAREHGIDVHFINPRKTSQRCSKCGHIDKKNRKRQDQFECTSCGFKMNADVNASRNIALPDIEQIIEAKMKEGEK